MGPIERDTLGFFTAAGEPAADLFERLAEGAPLAAQVGSSILHNVLPRCLWERAEKRVYAR